MKVRYLLIGMTVLFIFGFLTASSYAKLDPTTIVGLWLFDEGKGNIATDSSGNKNNGTLMNGPKWVAGKFGNALSFDGAATYVDCGNDASLHSPAFTAEAWIYHNAYTGDGDAVLGNSRWNVHFTEGYVMRFWRSDTIFEYIKGSAGAEQRISNTIPLQTWTHVAMSYDGTTFNMYKNGDLVTCNSINYTEPTQSLWIGKDHTNINTICFNGIIDEVAVFNVALVVGDIQTTMNKGLKESLNPTAVDLSGKLTATWASIKAR